MSRGPQMFDFAKARQQMVESQIRTCDVTDLEVVKAFRAVAREKFVPKSKQALAYSDSHINLGDDRVLMAPRDFSKLVQAAEIKPSDVVLDIACGRGYSTAILSRLADTVVGLEDSADRVAKATDELTNSDISNAAILEADLKAGAPEHGPFNVIFVNGAIQSVPKTWLDQLAHKGRLVAIVQNGPIGHATVFTRTGDVVGERVIFDASVPALMALEPVAEFVF